MMEASVPLYPMIRAGAESAAFGEVADAAGALVDRLKETSALDLLPEAFVSAYEAEVTPRDLGRKGMLAYLRASSDDQEASVPTQKAEAEKYARKIGATELVFEFDDGVTGTFMDERPGLQRALDRVCDRDVEIFWVFRASRASREAADLLKIWSIVERSEAELHTADRGKIGEMEVLFEAVFGQTELKRMKGQLLAGVRRMITKDKRVNSHVSFGFQPDAYLKGVHRPHPVRKQDVLRAFEERANGVSPTVIARDFSARGIPTRRECWKLDRGEIALDQCRCQWNASMINEMFDNTLHMGVISYHKTGTVKDPRSNKVLGRMKRPKAEWSVSYNPDLAIVSAALWHLVYAIRRGSAALSAGRAGLRSKTYLCTGLTHCERCGSKMKGYAKGGSAHHPVIKCGTAIATPDRCEGCGVHQIAVIEKLVLEVIWQKVMSPELVDYYKLVYSACQADITNEIAGKRARIEAEIAKANAALDLSFDSISMQGYDAEDAARQRQRATTKRNEARAKLGKLPNVDRIKDGLDRLDELSKALAWLTTQVPFRPEDADGRKLVDTLRALITNITIKPPTAGGEVAVIVQTNVEEAVGVPAPASPLFPLQQTNVVSYNLHEMNAAARLDNEERSKADKLAQIRSGAYDLTDSAWQDLQPIVGGFTCDDVGGTRHLLNGMLYLAKCDISFVSSIPDHYCRGDQKAFNLAIRRFCYSHAWDACRAVLEEKHEAFVAGANMNKFDGTRYKRSPAHKGKFSDDTAEDIRRAMAEIHCPVALKRLEAVARLRDGDLASRIANEIDTPPQTIKNWNTYYSALGVRGISGLKCRSKEKLTETQVKQLEEFVLEEVNPYRPGHRIDLATLVKHSKATFGRSVSEHYVCVTLAKYGSGLRTINQGMAKKRAAGATAGLALTANELTKAA